jgi:hypothetical protein
MNETARLTAFFVTPWGDRWKSLHGGLCFNSSIGGLSSSSCSTATFSITSSRMLEQVKNQHESTAKSFFQSEKTNVMLKGI